MLREFCARKEVTVHAYAALLHTSDCRQNGPELFSFRSHFVYRLKRTMMIRLVFIFLSAARPPQLSFDLMWDGYIPA